MKSMTKRISVLLLAICMIVSLALPASAANQPSATEIITTASGYTSASDVTYPSSGYIANWGARGEVAKFISAKAADYYTSSYEELSALAKEDLDAARRGLCDILSNYAGFTKHRLVVVFDGYKRSGNPGEKSQFHNIQVVYTKEGETCDAYIEALVHDIGGNYAVRVATSDNLIQISSLRSGVLRMSARELLLDVEAARKEMGEHFRK